jgi:NAD(P)-dependent dehydrogenase (short-subunit alcohol dehydrogenase family)
MDFSNRTVVVTGGTGALGTAVVGSLIAAGAACHVPYMHDAKMQHFPHRASKQLTLISVKTLSDENDVATSYEGVSPL